VSIPDPFGTADLRRVVLAAWAASAARFREDANAEDLLASGGYAGRALVELAANGVDAARELGVPARLRIRLVGAELRIANTGSPLTSAGVAGLSSLRASAKRKVTGSVGFFGVGFTAVLGWSSAPRVVSTTGGVRFDEAATRAAVQRLADPALDEELLLRGGHVPVLRLPWPSDPTEEPPPPGYATEVRLPLADAVIGEVGVLLDDPDTFADLLWALPELTELDLPDRVIRRHAHPDGTVTVDEGDRTTDFRVVTRSGDVPAGLLAGRPVEQRGRTRWTLHWVRPLNVESSAVSDRRTYTIGAPTPTDEPTTLPARLVGTMPVDDTRRRLAAGPLLDHLLAEAADAYLELVLAADPDERWRLLPTSGFPAGPVDGQLRGEIVRRIESTPLLHTAAGDWVTPGQSCVLPGIDADAAAVIAQAVPGLLPPITPAVAAALRPVGLTTLGWAQVTAALAGLERPPAFWREVYRAAADAQPGPRPDDLADVPIPLVGGRRAVGARGCLLPAIGHPEPAGITADLARRIGDVVPDLRVVHPDAVHPLLLRLGAVPAEPAAVLADPALAARIAALRQDLEDADPDPAEVRSVAHVVLDLFDSVGDSDGSAVGALADLVLTDEDDNPWPAVELLVPGAAIADVLDPEVDRVVVGPAWISRYGADLLVRAGVRDGPPVVWVVDPVPDAVTGRLPDLDEWFELAASMAGEPFTALADLDLIDAARWPRALALIAGDPLTRGCLQPTAAAPSYSGWWIARHALVDGRPPGHWRLPAATELDGLYDPLPIDLDATLARWIGVRVDLASAAADDPDGLLDRLADPDQAIPPARVIGLTAAVVDALDRADVNLPKGVRTLTGAVIDAEAAYVLDEPWWAQVEQGGRLVPGGADPATVGRVLDLPLVSEALGPGTVTTAGPAPAEAGPRWSRAAEAMGIDPAAVPLTVATTVRVTLGRRKARSVRWWSAGGRYHCDGSAESLGRIAAWAAGRWSRRHLAVAAAAQDGTGLAEAGVG
jgi:hypothetical protein